MNEEAMILLQAILDTLIAIKDQNASILSELQEINDRQKP